jgi:dephospho-CoA kinase
MISFNELNIIGLTGMSGAGKTLAARVFAERGFCVIDCDRIAKQIISSEKCTAEIKKVFPEMYDKHGEFNRKKAAGVVFSDTKKLKQYERIIYPFIIYGVIKYIENKEGKKNFLLDAPTLYQSGADDFCKKIIAVIADKATCTQRISARDSISEEDAVLRLNSQPGADFYMGRVDYLIENNGEYESFIRSIKETAEEIK